MKVHNCSLAQVYLRKSLEASSVRDPHGLCRAAPPMLDEPLLKVILWILGKLIDERKLSRKDGD